MRPEPRPQLNPDKTQFFKYDSVSLSCSSGDSGPWTVLRNTSTDTRGRCGEDWGRRNSSVCTIGVLFPEDTGLYWCERDKRSSEPVNISVSEHRETFHTSPPPAPAPSTFSTAPSPPPPFRPSSTSSDLLVPLVCSGLGLFLLLLLLLLLLLWWKRCKQTPGVRDDARPEEGGAGDVTYSDLLHRQQRRPITRREREESPVYSTVKTEDVCYSSITFNQTRDPAKRTRKQNDSSTYAQIRVRTT